MAGQSLSQFPLITSDPIIFLFRSHTPSDVLFSSFGNYILAVWVMAALALPAATVVMAFVAAAVAVAVAAMVMA